MVARECFTVPGTRSSHCLLVLVHKLYCLHGQGTHKAYMVIPKHRFIDLVNWEIRLKIYSNKIFKTLMFELLRFIDESLCKSNIYIFLNSMLEFTLFQNIVGKHLIFVEKFSSGLRI